MENKKRFLISAAYYITIGLAVFFILKYAVFAVMPFLAGFGIAALLNPIVRKLKCGFGMKGRPTAILILLIFYGTIGMFITVFSVKLVVLIGDFSKDLPTVYNNTIEPIIARGFDLVNGIIMKLDGKVTGGFSADIGGIFNALTDSLGAMVSSWSMKILGFLSGIAAAVPGVIIGLLFTVISSFFFIIDYEKLMEFAKSRLPVRAVGIMTDMRDRFFVTVLKYLRSYALILLITFGELFLGLTLLGVKNGAVYALIIALLDILPVIGTGSVMIPWAVIELVGGNGVRGIGLLSVWAAVTVVRNIIEPKIVGAQVGLHPLATLIAMFAGTKLFGFFGLITLPVLIAIVWSLIKGEHRSSEHHGV